MKYEIQFGDLQTVPQLVDKMGTICNFKSLFSGFNNAMGHMTTLYGHIGQQKSHIASFNWKI